MTRLNEAMFGITLAGMGLLVSTACSRQDDVTGQASAATTTAVPMVGRAVGDQPAQPAAATAAAPLAGPAEAIAQAEQELLEAWESVCSVSGRVRTQFDREQGHQTHQIGSGHLECMKKDGKLLMRYEAFNQITAKRPHEEDKWIRTAQGLIRVCDGEFLYTFDRRYDSTTITKSFCEPPAMRDVGGERLFRRLRKLQNRRLLPEETIDGRAVHVLEGSSANGNTHLTDYVDKATGTLLKAVMKRKRNDTTFTWELSEVEFDREFPEERFRFVPDLDVPITDLTQGKAPAAETDAGDDLDEE